MYEKMGIGVMDVKNEKIVDFFREKRNYYNISNGIKRVVVSIFRLLLLISIGYVIIYPLMYMITNSIRTGQSYFDPTITWITTKTTVSNFVYAMEALSYFPSLKNTLIYEIIPAIIQLGSCAVAAYGFARFEFKGKGLLTIVLFITILLPVQASMLPSYINYSHIDILGIFEKIYRATGTDLRINLINTPLVFYLPALFGVGLKSGIIIYIYIQFFKGLPKELEEAAWIDGSGPIRTFLVIAIPSSSVVILTNLIFSIIWHWNDFFQAAMYLKERSNFTLAVQLSEIQNTLDSMRLSLNGDTPATVAIIMAACLLYVLPILVMYMCLQTKFVKSIDRVGITG